MSDELLQSEYKCLSEVVVPVNAKINLGKDPNKPYVGLENIPSRASRILSWEKADSSISTNAVFSAGDVLFGKLRPNLRKCVAAPFDGYCSTDVLILRAVDGIEPAFAVRVLQSEKVGAAAERSAIGTKMPRTAWEHLSDIVVFCPEGTEQRKVADVLGTLDSTIQKTASIVEKLKQVKQGLLHDLLTRGVDANGELRPSYEEAPDLYQESPCGWIPKAWKALGLADFESAERSVIRTGPFGSSLKGEHWRESGRPVVTIGSLGIGKFIEEELLFIDEFTARRLSEYELMPGDIVFSRVADVGRSVVVNEAQVGWIMSSNFMRISVNKSKVYPGYLQLSLAHSDSVRKQMRATVNSGGRDVANSAILMGLRFPTPTPDEQGEIVNRNAVLSLRLENESGELAKLLEVKAGLMDDLLTGRVRVTPLLAQ